MKISKQVEILKKKLKKAKAEIRVWKWNFKQVGGKKIKKGCGKILEAKMGGKDCGSYCLACKKKHFCVDCGGKHKLRVFRKSSNKGKSK